MLLAVSLAACSVSAAGKPDPRSPDRENPASSAGPLGVLRMPSGATPWKEDRKAPLGLTAFVRGFYVKSAWDNEEKQYAQRKFLSGTVQGWINSDNSQQFISIARFANPKGAQSAHNDLVDALTQDVSKNETKVTDPVDQGAGIADSQPDSLGNDEVDLCAQVGDYLVDVHEYTARTPDPDAAAELLRQQVAVLKKSR